MRGWEQIQTIAQLVGGGAAVFLNTVLIKLILKESPDTLGEYKYLMIFIAGFEIAYSILDAIVQPMFHSFGTTFMLLVKRGPIISNKTVLEILAATYCGFFGSSLANFGVHFIYRYWVVAGDRDKLKAFKGYKMLIWLTLPIINGLVWALVGIFLCYPRKTSTDYLRKSVLESLDLDIDNIAFFAPYFYERNATGHHTIFYPSFIGILVDSASIGISSLIVCLYGYKCYCAIHSTLHKNTSEQNKQLQSQLYNALVTQTLIPVVLMHIPALAMFICSFANCDLGAFSGIVSVTIALFPALDPIPTIFIIQNYRNAVKRFFQKWITKCSRCSQSSGARKDQVTEWFSRTFSNL